MNCKKISVIVPVFKVEDVLARCLDSLCRQSLRDIEIILVDDASPDQCGRICERYATQDGRIRVFHHLENRGLSAARNTGIAHASAEYLMFVDSDDWVHEDFCRLPYECAVRQQANLVMFNFQKVIGSDYSRPYHSNIATGYKTREEAIELSLNNPSVWNKLYRRELFNDVVFPEGYLFEDVAITHKIFWKNSGLFFINESLYYYCVHPESITTLKTEKTLRDWIEMHMQRYRDLAAWGYPSNKLERLLYNFALTYCIRKKPNADDVNFVFCRQALQSSKQIPDDFTWRRKMLFVLLKYCPPLFDLVCEMWGKRW